MLLSLGIPYVSYVSLHFKCLFIQTQPTRALTATGGGYHLGALNIRSDHSPSFPSSILHFCLIAPPGLQLCQPFNHLAKPHRTSIDRKDPITSGFKHSILSWVAHALSHCTPVKYGRIASISGAHDTTQFGDSICHVCVSTFQMLVHLDPTDAGLNRHRWGSQLGALKIRSDHSPSFPSSVLHFPIIAPPGL
jgi:hypothetical protein